MAMTTKTSLENKHFKSSDCFVIIAFSSHLLLLTEHAANGLVEGFEVNIENERFRSCSIGINRFRLVGLVELFRVLLAKNRFRLVWLLNFFNPHQTGLKRLKKHW